MSGFPLANRMRISRSRGRIAPNPLDMGRFSHILSGFYS
jgi:hypothetical protein